MSGLGVGGGHFIVQSAEPGSDPDTEVNDSQAAEFYRLLVQISDTPRQFNGLVAAYSCSCIILLRYAVWQCCVLCRHDPSCHNHRWQHNLSSPADPGAGRGPAKIISSINPGADNEDDNHC